MALALIMSTILGEPRLLLVSHLVRFSGRSGWPVPTGGVFAGLSALNRFLCAVTPA